MELIIGAGVAIVTAAIPYYLYKRKFKKSMDLQYFFSRNGCSVKKELFQVIDQTKETLDIAMFLLTQEEFVSHICQASQRGVKVRLISDRRQSIEPNDKQKANIKKLIECGVPVKVNSYDGTMHLKIMISDKQTVTAGSYNWTYSAEEKNDEVILILRNKKLAEEWELIFEQKWKDLKHYSSFNYYVCKKGA
ncbi:phospholipase D-like domain-containing protein [Halobacillus massiliensis]|uniref:phospholipase D-like domain-containing protein n=1 Tax=Halobacillus massiliensis TaxID=1926286 RepID=UPI0009E59F1D|nr:phospholipase D-like domain-containing protein [Halobacillus massiliensis]